MNKYLLTLLEFNYLQIDSFPQLEKWKLADALKYLGKRWRIAEGCETWFRIVVPPEFSLGIHRSDHCALTLLSNIVSLWVISIAYFFYSPKHHTLSASFENTEVGCARRFPNRVPWRQQVRPLYQQQRRMVLLEY